MVVFQECHLLFELVGKPNVIGVEKGDQFSSGMLYPEVAGH